ncbi:globoside alpha-1,3-N-acetylgalactosaminyltransferase 1 [Melospiza melodia melodia]|uniref:globoside alpha-1,3-N-acetylgalactosaminyltransferase 1 n=1 Tax=Melospiza melodia melodia TaxID=1914991 RepID=UPI002FD00C8F
MLRQDVLTVTPWLVPIIWEGTFDAEILDSACRPLNLTMGVAAFAVGKQGQHPVGAQHHPFALSPLPLQKGAARPSLSLLCPTGCVCSGILATEGPCLEKVCEYLQRNPVIPGLLCRYSQWRKSVSSPRCATMPVLAAWQQESHPNRHFVSHKPSKLLSPEQIWGDRKPKPPKSISYVFPRE